MSRGLLILSTIVAVTAAFAGCHTPQDTEDPSDPINGDPDRQITGVEVLSAPASVEEGGEATVCWLVEGRGTIPHTAVHWDNQSHAGDRVQFGDYGPQVGYPDNNSAQDPDGYEIPQTFCTNISVQNDTVYFRAHAMITAPGLLSPEHSIAVTHG